MNTSLPIPTDNIYKFSCLFGLALIISSLFAFVAMYSSSLDRKIKYAEIVIPLEAKTPRTKTEDDILEMNRKLIEVTRSNETFWNQAIGCAMGLGTALCILGAWEWLRKIQPRDDRLAALQVEKLEAEIAKLKAETAKINPPQETPQGTNQVPALAAVQSSLEVTEPASA